MVINQYGLLGIFSLILQPDLVLLQRWAVLGGRGRPRPYRGYGKTEEIQEWRKRAQEKDGKELGGVEKELGSWKEKGRKVGKQRE